MPRHSPCALVRLNFLACKYPLGYLLNWSARISSVLVLTWIAWVSYKTWIIVFFAAIRFSFLLCFASPSLISQLTKLFLPFDWKDLISQSLSKSRFVFVLSICFFILNFSLYSIFNEPEALASWTPTHILSDVWLSSPPNLGVVGTSGLEPPTSRLSGARSNLLSYAPI